MKTRVSPILAGLMLLICAAMPAQAHRLDEYLQATTISVEKDHALLRMRLTPGVAVAAKVLAALDTDGNGIISAPEQLAYAQKVIGDLTLRVDGSPVPLQLVSHQFPAAEEMKAGLGDIVLELKAPLPPGPSKRTLIFENRFQSSMAAYLVNCLVPRDPDIRVLQQTRNNDQSFYQLDFTVGLAPEPNAATSTASQAEAMNRADHLAVFKTYFFHGVHHILTGYDHLLFVSALVLAATTLWDLVKVVSAFTLAHSITLTLAALDLVHVSPRVVEPLISASIVFVALQNIFSPARSRGTARLAAAFFFGLFHGLGFAGGLLDLMHQLPKGTILLALLGFSIGVEAGHQMVLLPLFASLKTVRHFQKDAVTRTRLSMGLQRFGSAGISVAGVYFLTMALAGNY